MENCINLNECYTVFKKNSKEKPNEKNSLINKDSALIINFKENYKKM